ncbi:hypothetical protein JG688_00015066 [Phytophthora aleatoria]|uniref:Uncharacterized protein n=1 Tax=Phytophthora aleatoria TaxID=2496075 RepID=A0A8J5M2X5_9STRA|nr:hypothetical protein JG688_00015066 [Phytophthora aleatoria]
MYASRDRGSFIAVVSIDPDVFDCLLQEFSWCYTVKSGLGKRGRPPEFNFRHAVLACVLHFYTAAVESKTLCELFGVPPATLSRVLAMLRLHSVHVSTVYQMQLSSSVAAAARVG